VHHRIHHPVLDGETIVVQFVERVNRRSEVVAQAEVVAGFVHDDGFQILLRVLIGQRRRRTRCGQLEGADADRDPV